MYNVSRSVTLYHRGITDSPLPFSDTAADTAYSQIMAHRDVHTTTLITGEEDMIQEIIVPYHAIVEMIATKNVTESTAPADGNCGGES